MAETWQTEPDFQKTNLRMLHEEILCDVTFLAGEEKQPVKAHIFMLASRSPVFHAMFCGPLAESGDVVSTPDIEEDVFKLLLRYMYTADCPLTPDTVMAILYAANKYELVGLSTRCSEYLRTNMKPDNVCTILQQAYAFDDKHLLNRCIEFVCKNGSECLRSDSFLTLSLETTKLILKSDELSADEEDVYTACVKWAESQCRKRSQEVTDTNCRSILGDALTLVRFPLMPVETFSSVVSVRDILTSEEKVRLFQYLVSKTDSTSVGKFSCKSRDDSQSQSKPVYSKPVTVCRLPDICDGWFQNGLTNAIGFSCSIPCCLTGVGLFTPMTSGSIEGSLTVYEGDRELTSQDIYITYHPGIKIIDFKLSKPVYIKKSARYTITQTCWGVETYCGGAGQDTVSKDGLVVNFYYSSKSESGTNERIGQFRHFLFRL